VQIGYMNTDPKGLRVSFSLWADGRFTQRNPFRPLSDDEILKHVRGTGALPGKGAVMVCLESPDMTLSKLLAAVARLDAIVTRAGGRADNVEIILIPPPLPAKTDPGDQLPQKRSRPDEKP
jgi:hypothetical protein